MKSFIFPLIFALPIQSFAANCVLESAQDSLSIYDVQYNKPYAVQLKNFAPLKLVLIQERTSPDAFLEEVDLSSAQTKLSCTGKYLFSRDQRNVVGVEKTCSEMQESTSGGVEKNEVRTTCLF